MGSEVQPMEKTLFEGSFALDCMLESPDGFLAQKCVMGSESFTGALPAMKLTLGLVRDQPVLSEYVVLRRVAGVWCPGKPYASSHVLPITWLTSILKDRSLDPAPAALSTSKNSEQCQLLVTEAPMLVRAQQAEAASTRIPASTLGTEVAQRADERNDKVPPSQLRLTDRSVAVLLAPRPKTSMIGAARPHD